MKLNVEKSNKFKKIISGILICSSLTLVGCEETNTSELESNSLNEEFEIQIDYQKETQMADELCYYYIKINAREEITDLEKNVKMEDLYEDDLSDIDIYQKYYEASKQLTELFNFNVDGEYIDKNLLLTQLENVYLFHENPKEITDEEWQKYFGALEFANPDYIEKSALIIDYYQLSEILHEESCLGIHYYDDKNLKCRTLEKTLEKNYI